MNILYYIEEPKTGKGGVVNVASYLSEALSKKADVTYFPRLLNSEKGVLNLFNVYRKYVMGEFDLIHFNLVPSWMNGSPILLKSARLRRIATVLVIHGLIQMENMLETELSLNRLEYKRRLEYKINILSVLSSCNSVDRIVVNSKFMRTNVCTFYGISPDKIVVIPNGVDIERFSGCIHKIALDGDPSILFLGYLSKIKGLDILIRAIAKLRFELPYLKLHVVGHGDAGGEWASLLVKQQGVEKYVIFHGAADPSLVPAYYKSANIFVSPSRYEGFGITILEAMASGIPIIASNIESFNEILTDGENAIFFKSEDVDALSKAILTLYQDPNLRKQISQSALKEVTKYSWSIIAQKYISLYESALYKK